MFPLGSVLVPSGGLPLHVFEPRYRTLVHDCLARNWEFGVVLIARGSEVGGADVRTDVGTAARIVESAELPDGRWALVAVGVRRIRVQRWLEDDPYPRADVELAADEEDAGQYSEEALDAALEAAAELAERQALRGRQVRYEREVKDSRWDSSCAVRHGTVTPR